MTFGWPDHHAPALNHLCKIVSSLDSYALVPSPLVRGSHTMLTSANRWLKADPLNVAVVHCLVRTRCLVPLFSHQITCRRVKGAQERCCVPTCSTPVPS